MSRLGSSFIFVSYSSKDTDFVHSEIKRLERQGYQVWYDKGELQPGLLWDKEISEAIEACACFIVFITQDAIDSQNVLKEMDQALTAGKPFICIYWEEVKLPSRFQEPVRKIQSLERYSLRRFEYEEPLCQSLSKYVTKRETSPEENIDRIVEAHALPTPVTQSDVPSKILFLGLILLIVIFVVLAIVPIMAPHLTAYPGSPLNERLAAFLVSFVFIAIAFVLGGGAFAVYRIYLRRSIRKKK